MPNTISKIQVDSVLYDIVDPNAATKDELPVGEVNLTLTQNSISDGTTTLKVPTVTVDTANKRLTIGIPNL